MAQTPLHIFHDKSSRTEKIAMISLYDAPSAALACDAGADVLLVGDSLGSVILGYESTLHVTLEDMVRHTSAVVRGVKSSLHPDTPVIADLPFGYCADETQARTAAVALMQCGAQGVKIEGANARNLSAIEALVHNGIPVMAHLGYTPQSAMQQQTIVQGRDERDAELLWSEAQSIANAGCFGVVLEAVAMEVAKRITTELAIPTIGIGAGPDCDGQVLVWHDLIGLSSQTFRFAKQFSQARDTLSQATRDYVEAVHTQNFPTVENGWRMKKAS